LALAMLSWYDVAVLSEFVCHVAYISCLSFQRGISVEGCRVHDFTLSRNKKDEKDVGENPSDCAISEFCTFCYCVLWLKAELFAEWWNFNRSFRNYCGNYL
jgi:hypothetical protein